MSNAEHSDRRRRVIFMHSEDAHTGPDAEAAEIAPRRDSSRETEVRRLPESDLPQSLLSEFRRACGQTRPFLIRVSSSESDARPQSVLWDRPTLLIGRNRECDLRLNHAEVSRQHAYLQIVNGGLYCADLGSGGGTHWPHGESARQFGPLDFGEAVSIGPYSLTVEPDVRHEPFEASTPTSGTGPGGPGLFLDFHDGNNETRRWPATRDVTLIGSGNAAKVKLVHPTVSKAHCAIVRAAHSLWVVDLLSEEGTLVNGRMVSVIRLESGDVIRVGRFTIGTHYGSPLDDEMLQLAGLAPGSPKPQTAPDPSTDLSRLQQQALAAAANQGSGGGVSEQFVLDVINQMGVMQQQVLKHAQQSMVQALQAVSSTYQSRIEALEQEHESLKRLLQGPVLPGDPHAPRALPDLSGDFDPVMPFPPGMIEPEFDELPEPEHGSYECDDPHVREQWVREKMKLVEAELDKTRKGWGRRLIELMGY